MGPFSAKQICKGNPYRQSGLLAVDVDGFLPNVGVSPLPWTQEPIFARNEHVREPEDSLANVTALHQSPPRLPANLSRRLGGSAPVLGIRVTRTRCGLAPRKGTPTRRDGRPGVLLRAVPWLRCG